MSLFSINYENVIKSLLWQVFNFIPKPFRRIPSPYNRKSKTLTKFYWVRLKKNQGKQSEETKTD